MMDDSGNTREDVKAEGEVLSKIEKMQEEGQDVCKWIMTFSQRGQANIQ